MTIQNLNNIAVRQLNRGPLEPLSRLFKANGFYVLVNLGLKARFALLSLEFFCSIQPTKHSQMLRLLIKFDLLRLLFRSGLTGVLYPKTGSLPIIWFFQRINMWASIFHFATRSLRVLMGMASRNFILQIQDLRCLNCIRAALWCQVLKFLV